MIYGDIEDAWTPTADWFKGWVQGMRESDYWGEGGLYANLNVVNFTTPYLKALTALGLGGDRFLWSTQPVKGCKKPGDIDFQYQPAGTVKFPTSVVMWQYGRACLGTNPTVFQGVDFNLCNDTAFAKMWSG
jgi:hypothetical protein